MPTVRSPLAPRTTTSARHGQRARGPVARGIVVAEAADDGGHLPDDRIGDHPRDVSEQAPARLANPRRALDGDVANGGAEGQRAVERHRVEPGGAIDVDEHRRTREPKAHRGNQALPARRARVPRRHVLQMREGLVDGTSADVVEGWRDHSPTSWMTRKRVVRGSSRSYYASRLEIPPDHQRRRPRGRRRRPGWARRSCCCRSAARRSFDCTVSEMLAAGLDEVVIVVASSTKRSRRPLTGCPFVSW